MANANDLMVKRLSDELEERSAFVQGLIRNAQDAGRDLDDNEEVQIRSAKDAIKRLEGQLTLLEETATIAGQVAERSATLDRAITKARMGGGAEPEFRSAGEYIQTAYMALIGNREAQARLELSERAAAHQKTSDNLGVVPDPIVGSVLNYIDAARPIVAAIGAQPLPAATWYRPKVTQHVTVGKQGTNGAAADEKTELLSQKMIVTRISANAVTYGGYVNVSRQNIDLGSGVLDLVVNDLAAQYSLATEAATAALLNASANTVEVAGTGSASTAQNWLEALWTAAGNVYNAVKGQGRLVLAVSPDRLGTFGPLFQPYNATAQQSTAAGLSAGAFGQDVMGSISGIPVIMSSGLAASSAVLFSTAAVEAYEQKVGVLQVSEPSVLGVQVGYAGYFTPITVEAGGIQKIVNAV